MIFNGLQHVGIPTKKFDESGDFYQSLGFKLVNTEDNQGSRVAFYQLGTLMLESWESPQEAPGKVGAINHIALDTNDINRAFAEVQKLNVQFVENGIQSLPYWENGIKYFNFYGPNKEIFEVCQKL
ncbi:Glyoxalase-like domain protein [Lactobacillus kimbladii]|uniref:Glyoxalase-like domain protein n=1 Tax=Lactobacillus kimbladii TaxID=1218506 RepID=A0A0F4LIB7_9LACO|nr:MULTISPECIES: VOC family protein [Lactobacillus]KJY57306.1 Glyoxalase-like domain protein [Lactobacillus kimbladii]MBI0120598.1 VOC family protein [Lactobacillus sp. M0398]MBI0122934.1 VOC family protein [Lactobacillus sp. W8174]MBI0134915.1 VOC family protein [Lactobacillus sp. W8173]